MKTEFMNKSKLSKRSKSIDGAAMTNRSISKETGGIKMPIQNSMNNIFQVQEFSGTESKPTMNDTNVHKTSMLKKAEITRSTSNLLSSSTDKTSDKAKITSNAKNESPLNPLNNLKILPLPLGKGTKFVPYPAVTKKPLTEKEIEKKVEDYKKKLMSELLKVLSEEKFKEEERELLYNKTSNLIEKKRLEKIIAIERAQSSERIMHINEYLL
jgi:hypothetical protein